MAADENKFIIENQSPYFLHPSEGPGALIPAVIFNGKNHALEIVNECGLLGGKPVDFPVEQNHKFALAKGKDMDDPSRYRWLIGRLIYLTITRPELSYTVHVLSEFMQNPKVEHIDAARRVLRYIKGSSDEGLFPKADSSLQVQAYCDSDWGACHLTRPPLTGYFVTLGGSPVSWKTKKQNVVSRSSAEAEYQSRVSAVEVIAGISWCLSLRTYEIVLQQPGSNSYCQKSPFL